MMIVIFGYIRKQTFSFKDKKKKKKQEREKKKGYIFICELILRVLYKLKLEKGEEHKIYKIIFLYIIYKIIVYVLNL